MHAACAVVRAAPFEAASESQRLLVHPALEQVHGALGLCVRHLQQQGGGAAASSAARLTSAQGRQQQQLRCGLPHCPPCCSVASAAHHVPRAAHRRKGEAVVLHRPAADCGDEARGRETDEGTAGAGLSRAHAPWLVQPSAALLLPVIFRGGAPWPVPEVQGRQARVMGSPSERIQLRVPITARESRGSGRRLGGTRGAGTRPLGRSQHAAVWTTNEETSGRRPHLAQWHPHPR